MAEDKTNPEFICIYPAKFSLPDYLMKFLIKKIISFVPIDFIRRFGKKEGHELGEIGIYDVFPRAIVIVVSLGLQ